MLLRMILFQAVPPFLSMTTVVTVLIIIFALPQTSKGGLLLVGLLPTQYITVFNPCITLFSIKSYRQTILCQKSRKEKPSSIIVKKIVPIMIPIK